MDEDILKEMQKYGKFLEERGLNLSSHSGNMSIRRGDRLFIKRRGAMMGDLKQEDVVETGIDEDDSGVIIASTEVGVHREIYKETSSLAVVHAHTPYAISLSLIKDEIVPIDDEGRYHLKKVPVLDVKESIGSDEVEKRLPPILQDYPAAIVKGHGTFAHGENLEEAYNWITVVESICKIIYIVENLGGDTMKEVDW
ncbi:MAG: aldolase [Candidatus Thermoplasmatota archaeon]|nr:aldolase [Candidatus Thermoplasmatota archaeon]MBS3790135.1 aldolase [Candidatus Thermoplasmatota archaeon]